MGRDCTTTSLAVAKPDHKPHNRVAATAVPVAALFQHERLRCDADASLTMNCAALHRATRAAWPPLAVADGIRCVVCL